MRRHRRLAFVAGVVLACCAGRVRAADEGDGKAVYEIRCAPCHGSDGGGDGPAAAALAPKPRNFRDPTFWRGRTRTALRLTVEQGRPGTMMSPFKGVLTDAEIDGVVRYVESFRPRNSARLIVMAKYPEPGRVKTRLAAALGDDSACALYRAFILDLADRLAPLPYEVIWAYDPAPAPFAALLPRARCVAQVAGDLGARMAHAVAAAFAEHSAPVVVLGADVPHVSAASLQAAAAVTEGRVVIGPAEDGGYYLIGLARPAPELFADVCWGGDSVLQATRAHARRLGLETELLPPTFDVDEAADIERLRALLDTDAVALPRTAAVLASLRS